jgi:eukaryotic-like serine/threonine-protein kinase
MSPPAVRPLRAVGRYLLFGELAAGGMASVHLGRLVGPVGFSRTVAIKRLHPELARDPEGVSAFLDEARLTARVHHPNVVQTIDVVELPGELFLVMEYVRGETLTRLLRATSTQGGRIPLRIATAILTNTLYGLHAAHEAKNERGQPLGIVHRDVSPQNIIVGTDGVARVLDFGVAKAIGRVQSTSQGQVKGKLAYMPPEQISAGQLDRRSDIYAAAVVLWETLCAHRLFEGDAQGVIIGKILRGEFDSPRKHLPDLPASLEAVVMKGLAHDPEQRYATALDMATDLERHGVASPREVGEWVEAMAGEMLAKRASLIEEIESASHNELTIAELKRTALATSSRPLPPVTEDNEATRTDSSIEAQRVPPSSSTASSVLAVDSPSVVTPPRSKKAVVLGAGVLGLLALLSFLAFRTRREEGPAAALAPVAPAASPVPSASVAAPPPSASAASPVSSSSAPPVASAPPRSTPPRGGKAATPAPRRDCTPPYRIDGDGIRHMKPECF